LQRRGYSAILDRLVRTSIVEADKILELGVGLGANIPFLSEIGEYYGIEGSEKAVTYLHNEFPRMADRIALADFSRVQPFGTGFDAVVERASVPHNDIAAIKRTLALVWASLKPGGLFISSDWFSMNHSEAYRGETIEASANGRTATCFPDGQFVGLDSVHFSDVDELSALFAYFERLTLQERIERRKGPGFAPRVVPVRWRSAAFNDKDYDLAVWDIIVRKPK
jgi:SAM-dependent methyltransferase